eukprot:CAMPEP_0119108102 /NCGR_PEP_ID=MMETSP1180-20130426/13469_1 /TAXON_ID=3052 ORGANISM="Chlamydomonas cf sp, Strain CCMP681" /NCGR_SAMPLE_ID=MMETSP1180 /ASSEMBLY_ACC=CAM_ASM_000741 /LENGTH=260 /DNA_ID=CAMNT_0007093685 /DNA_START=87 /DNA_END=869 /DNA_ORIENTATION=-
MQAMHSTALGVTRRAAGSQPALKPRAWLNPLGSGLRHVSSVGPCCSMLLAAAERDLGRYCNDNNCTELHQWFKHKWEDGEAKMALGQGASDRYVGFMNSVQELAASGSMKAMVKTLSIMKRTEERQTQERQGFHQSSVNNIVKASLEGRPLVVEPETGPTALTPEDRELLTKFFHKIDDDKDGKLTWTQFIGAMNLIGEDLRGEALELVTCALELQGFIALDDFLNAVQGVPAAETRFLLHQTHRGLAEQAGKQARSKRM